MRRFLVSLILVLAFALFLLLPEEPRGRWLDDGGPDSAFPSAPGLEDGEREPPGPRQTLSGYVRLPDGEPVAGVTVRLEHPWVPEVRATTDEHGHFELAPEEPRGELSLDDPRWLLLGGELVVSASLSDGYLLAVAAPIELVGRVVDGLGQPVHGADVVAHTPPGVLVPLGLSALPIEGPGHSALTNRAGSFRIGPLPDVAGLELEVRAAGFRPARVSAPAASEVLVIALEPEAG